MQASHACRDVMTIPSTETGNVNLSSQAIELRLEMIAEVAKKLTHDFRNTLTGILGYCELGLRRTPADAPHHHFFQATHGSITSATELTERIQLFAHRRQREPGQSSLEKVTQEVWRQLASRFSQSQTLTLDVEKNASMLSMPKAILTMLLTEFLTNAREVIDDNGSVSVKSEFCDGASIESESMLGELDAVPCAKITISDDGKGMDSDTLEKIFSAPFYSDKPRQRGYGLFVAYGILRTYGGGLRLSSAPSSGTSVEMILPLAEVVEQERKVPSTRQSISPLNKSILIVDDDPVILSVVDQILSCAGHTVEAVESGEQAWSSLENQGLDHFDLVITDWMMPQLSGADLAKRIFGSREDLPVVFMSGQVSMVEAQGQFQDRAVTLVKKPFSPQALLAAIESVV